MSIDECMPTKNDEIDLDEFDYETYFYTNNSSTKIDPTRNDFVAYIDRFRLIAPWGQLRARFNLDLKFFMNLKSLRLDYMNSLNMINKQQQTTSNKPDFNGLVESSASSLRKATSTASSTTASLSSSLSKIPQLQLTGSSNRISNEIKSRNSIAQG